ncbi:MAG: hypothetical protein C4311_12140 [Chloroflexota bacterium]
MLHNAPLLRSGFQVFHIHFDFLSLYSYSYSTLGKVRNRMADAEGENVSIVCIIRDLIEAP